MIGRKKWNEVDTGRIHKEHDAANGPSGVPPNKACCKRQIAP
ncbi:hypothetical protein BCAR13_840051 [Paraburkholderia caribensis]|nr:hypothetical protein BCAR13_840051 [Paraburkholderia caribensis]